MSSGCIEDYQLGGYSLNFRDISGAPYSSEISSGGADPSAIIDPTSLESSNLTGGGKKKLKSRKIRRSNKSRLRGKSKKSKSRSNKKCKKKSLSKSFKIKKKTKSRKNKSLK